VVLIGSGNSPKKMLNMSGDHQRKFGFPKTSEFLIGLESPKVCDIGGTPKTGGPYVSAFLTGLHITCWSLVGG